jgi:uncharacterized membrane protein
MDSTTSPTSTEPRGSKLPPLWVGVAVAAATVAAFLAVTPGGLLDKADAVGSAVCGRIEAHTFVVGGRPLPLCARCTGSFIGALVGFLGQAVVLRRGRASEFPPVTVVLLLVLFVLLWAGDGVNSYLDLLGAEHLYEPSNTLRLVVGALNGLTWSGLMYPVLNFTLWREPSQERAIRGLGDLAVLLLLDALFVGLVMVGWDWLLYVLSPLSALGVVAMLCSVNTVLVLTLLRRENLAGTGSEAATALLLGLAAAIVLIGGIDAVRSLLLRGASGLLAS